MNQPDTLKSLLEQKYQQRAAHREALAEPKLIDPTQPLD